MGWRARFAVLGMVVSWVGCSDDTGSGGSGGASSGGGGSAGAADTGGGGAGASGGEDASGGRGGGEAGGPSESHKRVFVSSLQYTGDFGGLAAAAGECQALADAEGLGGNWLSWMSDTMGNTPETRFTQSAVPYRLIGGTDIAADWADLVDGEIAAPIDRDETGTQVAESFAWTGTEADLDPVTPCCGDWMTLRSGAGLGNTARTNAEWSFIGGQPCDQTARLYCFEQ